MENEETVEIRRKDINVLMDGFNSVLCSLSSISATNTPEMALNYTKNALQQMCYTMTAFAYGVEQYRHEKQKRIEDKTKQLDEIL
jgi:Na+/phosphate symporter